MLMVGGKGRISQNTVQELRPCRTALLPLWRADILHTDADLRSQGENNVNFAHHRSRCGPLRMPIAVRNASGLYRSIGDGDRRTKSRRSHAQASEYRLAPG